MLRLVLVTLLLVVATSCGIEAQNAAKMESSNSLKQVGLELKNFHDTSNLALAQTQSAGGAADRGGEKSETPETAGRQIIYCGSISLHVESFAKTDEKIAALVKDAGGYISQSGEDRSYGARRGGRWTVRVPVDKFFTFLDSVGQLGVTDRRDVQSQDVS